MKNFFTRSGDLSEGANGPIAEAAKGLIFISETDSEIVPVTGDICDSVTLEAVREMSGLDGGAPMQEVDANEFFANLTQIKDWYGDREKARAAAFAKLYEVLKQEVRDLKVVRIGHIQIHIYVVGINGEGRLAGVMTRAVET